MKHCLRLIMVLMVVFSLAQCSTADLTPVTTTKTAIQEEATAPQEVYVLYSETYVDVEEKTKYEVDLHGFPQSQDSRVRFKVRRNGQVVQAFTKTVEDPYNFAFQISGNLSAAIQQIVESLAEKQGAQDAAADTGGGIDPKKIAEALASDKAFIEAIGKIVQTATINVEQFVNDDDWAQEQKTEQTAYGKFLAKQMIQTQEPILAKLMATQESGLAKAISDELMKSQSGLAQSQASVLAKSVAEQLINNKELLIKESKSLDDIQAAFKAPVNVLSLIDKINMVENKIRDQKNPPTPGELLKLQLMKGILAINLGLTDLEEYEKTTNVKLGGTEEIQSTFKNIRKTAQKYYN